MDSPRDHLELEIAGLRAELARLAVRLSELEHRLRAPKPEAPREARPSVSPPPTPVPRSAPPAIPVTAAELREHQRFEPVRAAPPTAPPVQSASLAAPPPLSMAARAERALSSRPQSPVSWEKLIGAKAFAVAGALIVVLGVAFFLKLAIDEGWIRRIPPVWRCIGVAAFGGFLIILGEIARKKISTLASSGVSAAGIATVYASVYGAHEVFGLIAAPVAMAMLACVTAGGIALGVVGRRVFLSIISLVGAYLAPVLLSTGEPSPVFFPAYLVALLALGLTLGGWMGLRFQCLRSLSWWGTVLLGTLWMIDGSLRQAPLNALVFLGVVWALTHAELIASARFFRGVEEPEPAGDRSIGMTERMAPRARAHSRWIVSSFGVTTWALAFSILALRKLAPAMDYLAPVFLGVGLSAVSIIAMPRIMEIVSTRSTPRAQLATAAVIQTGAMVIAAVALGLTSWFQVSAWFALGLAAVIAGRRIGVTALRLYGMVLLFIGTGRLIVLDWLPLWGGFGEPATVWSSGWGLVLGPVGAQFISGGAAWFLGAMVLRRWRADSVIMASLGVACIVAAPVMPGAQAGSVAVAWALVGLGVMGLSRTACAPNLCLIGAGPIVASWFAWLVAYGNPDTWVTDGGPAIAFVGVKQAVGIICAALAGLAVVRKPDRSRGATVVVLWGTGLLVIAAVGLGLTGWVQVATWLTLGIGCIAGGEWARRPALRIYGTCLLVIGTAQVAVMEWLPACLGVPDPALATYERWGLVLGSASAQLAGAAGAWLIGSAVVRSRAPNSIAMAIVATACAMASFIFPGAHAGSVAVAWAAVGLGLAGLSRAGFIPNLRSITCAVVTVAWIPWLIGHANPDVWLADASPPLLSLGMRKSMLIAAAGALSVFVYRRSERIGGVVRTVFACTGVLMLMATSLEVHRLVSDWVPGDPTARRAGVSIWWALVGLGVLAGGTVRRNSVARWIGLGLLGAAAAKLVAFDLSTISMVWRVVASMVIGLILLGVAVGYARAMRGKGAVANPVSAPSPSPQPSSP